MSRACKCDACGDLYEPEYAVPAVRVVVEFRQGDITLDLCPECQIGLERFVNRNHDGSVREKD